MAKTENGHGNEVNESKTTMITSVYCESVIQLYIHSGVARIFQCGEGVGEGLWTIFAIFQQK